LFLQGSQVPGFCQQFGEFFFVLRKIEILVEFTL
jgi:hypothetical protein